MPTRALDIRQVTLVALALAACGPEIASDSDSATSTSGATASVTATGAPEPCSEVHEGDLRVLDSTDFASLANLGRVTGILHISLGQRDQRDLSFLSCLHTVDTGLVIQHNQHLESTDGMVNLQTLGSLLITENSSLRVVAGFDRIYEVWTLHLSDNPALEEIHLDSIQFVNATLAIGFCAWQGGIAGHHALSALSGFSGLTRADGLRIDGNEALLSLDLLDALAANGDPMPLRFAKIRFNPLLPEADISAKLDEMGVQSITVCGNEGGATECECPPIGA